MSWPELLDWMYAQIVERGDPEKRLALDRMLGLVPAVSHDPLLPEQLRGVALPDWWDDTEPDENWG